ncbi:unnamed protein product [Ambrosiozyma monospora]|uniref:Unnamed protein product n=1 Tax=Ambrosiozyma monospora TaxID=43982 RepID=A0A9W6YS63_AMBMO|nr:unnamed protein product [Ambrosiozyma monospora]
MSLRKSLYKQYNRSGTASSSFINLADADTGEKHWVRDWYDPPIPSSLEAAGAINGFGQLQKHQNGNAGLSGSGFHLSGSGTGLSSGMGSTESTPQPQSNGGALTAVGSQLSLASQSQTPQPYKTYGFKIKTWVMTDSEFQATKDCENEDVDTIINLESFKYGQKKQVAKASGEDDEVNEAGLTEADIKSAVGGGDGGGSLFSRECCC